MPELERSPAMASNGKYGKPWVMDASPGDEEAPKDPGARAGGGGGHTVSDQDISGHRHVFVGFHLPKRHGHGHGHGHEGETTKSGFTDSQSNVYNPINLALTYIPCNTHLHKKVTPPAQRVQFILGEEGRQEPALETHPVFSEMEELFVGEDGDMEWKETARWVKFEEDVEEGGNRWSKPHVATLSLHSLFELRSFLLNGTDDNVQVKGAILKKHRHQFEGLKKQANENGSSTNMAKLPLIRSLADIGKTHSSSKSMTKLRDMFQPSAGAGSATVGQGSDPNLPRNKSDVENNMVKSESSAQLEIKMNNHFMKKIPKGAEASNILVGEVDFLDKPLSAFIRLQEATILGDLTEVPVPTRFLFVLLGPTGGLSRYHEIGRAVATVMSDEIFHDVAYKAVKRDHLLAGLDEFLDAVTVLPPGEWDPSIRIEPPSSVPSQQSRKNPNQPKQEIDEEEEEEKIREESGLTRTGRFCGGLLNDIKRKKPWYISDFKDALSLQCVASYVFIYFACLTPIITFGGLLGDATKNHMASMESLVSGMICGVLFGMFSGQPLTILGSTGPVLVFETIVFDFCKAQEWNYLSFRLCIGAWIGLILIILVATDASAMVCYITRFTEENFATLIAVIFIIKAVDKLLSIGAKTPIHPSDCFCIPEEEFPGWNKSMSMLLAGDDNDIGLKSKQACSFQAMMNNTITDVHGHESVGCHYVPNAFLMSCLIFVGTFLISFHLKKFKTQNFFPTVVRQYISDFAVVIAILSMTLTDMMVGVDTPKLSVPDKFAPTLPTRDWLIHPLADNPWYTPILALVPALLGSILIFMDQQITAVIVNRKEHQLLKGGGYHLDLLIYFRSLTRESEGAAPGEKPQFLGIREQRVTHVLIFITVGLSVFMTPILSKIPMPVLYGVFLYMGVASLNGLQFFDRILLLFMPKKYQPDYPYLRQVQINRVHLFTLVQVCCFVALWLIKSFKQTSILFPVMLVIMIGVRKGLDFIFTKKELQVLDDILPEFKRHDRLDDEEALQELVLRTSNLLMIPAGILGIAQVAQNEGSEKDKGDGKGSLRCTKSSVEVPMLNGNVLKIPHQAINITEEMNKSGCWQSLEPNAATPLIKVSSSSSKGGSRKKSRRMSLVQEEEEGGITMKAGKPRLEEESKDEEETKNLVDLEDDLTVKS
ncbi:electroneutral sodium bicarbonate exchanger 1 [Eurytemora carolleeae]|uniref:electroneutral sodium bicarbonate exchanger 1 n=1 Tax=Eurytemora carolleeae TaxID=1294199 RepID=UPI000C784686|nr:electroneutral sodium bicarbonate exchanger 1 [Eurytemora carolleeae]|eukprot:XP_023335287.1 electroneutral sodium bicarbonate exchanger 1-like [Eurytemora affinis]